MCPNPIQLSVIKNCAFFSLLLCTIQITVWDYVRYGANDFLGEVLLELSNHPLDDEPEWYMLHGHQESNLHTVCSLKVFFNFVVFLRFRYFWNFPIFVKQFSTFIFIDSIL